MAKKNRPKDQSNNPLSLPSIIGGVIVTIIGTVVAAFIIQDARFAPSKSSEQQPPAVIVLPLVTVFPVVTPGAEKEYKVTQFDDPNGVFSIQYPSEFEKVTIGEENPNTYIYSFGEEYSENPETKGILFIGFAVAESPFNELQWQSIVSALGSAFLGTDTGENTFLVSTDISEEHKAFYEIKSKDQAGSIYMLLYLEESDGCLLTAFSGVKEENWGELRDTVYYSIKSIRWSPTKLIETLVKSKP